MVLAGTEKGLSPWGEPLLSLLLELRSRAQNDNGRIGFKSGFPKMSVLFAFGAGSGLSWELSYVLWNV